jgi:hypothetical protein
MPKEGTDLKIIQEIQEDPETDISGALKEWLLTKSAQNLQFAHKMFWCILSSMDETQSLQMSQHKNKEIWNILNRIVESHDCHDNSLEYKEDEFFKSFF